MKEYKCNECKSEGREACTFISDSDETTELPSTCPYGYPQEADWKVPFKPFWFDWQDYHTGGGCMAKRFYDKNKRLEYLVTSLSGETIPEVTDEFVYFGAHDDTGDMLYCLTVSNKDDEDIKGVWNV
jgi:hypothetical protein